MVYTNYVQWKEDKMIAQRDESEAKEDAELALDKPNAPEMKKDDKTAQFDTTL
jgi:hypothetical protein